MLYVLTDDVAALLAFQVLDGNSAGAFSVVAIMVINDPIGSSEWASFARGLMATGLSFGAMVSNVTGPVAQNFSR